MRRISLGVALLLGSTACSHHSKEADPAANAKVLFASGFEGLDGWVGDTPSLTAEKAHAGQFSIKVDPNIEYGLTFSKTLARLAPERVNKMRLTAWSFVTEKGAGDAALVFQITRPEQNGDNVYYKKIDLTKVGKWSKVSEVLELPPVIDPAGSVRVYLWRNKASAAVYLDDISLTVEP